MKLVALGKIVDGISIEISAATVSKVTSRFLTKGTKANNAHKGSKETAVKYRAVGENLSSNDKAPA